MNSTTSRRHRLRCRLQSLAWQVLGRLRRPPAKPIRVTASIDGAEVVLIARRPGAAEAATDGPSWAAMFLSAESRLILEAIGTGSAKGAAIARRTGMQDSNGQANAKLRSLIQDLVARGILDHDDEGYRATPPFLQLAGVLQLDERR